MSIGLDAIPLDVFRGIVAFGMGRFTVGRLDGGMKVCGPEHKEWSAHEERQSTARDLRALVGALGFHRLRCVSRRWRTTADELLRNTHERIFGVRPLVVKPVDGRLAREDPSYWLRRLVLGTLEDAAPWGELPAWKRETDPDGDEYLFHEPPSDALAVPWNAARYDVGTGDLDASTPVLAAVRRARACLAWRTSLTSFARSGCCGHDTRFRESLAWTGFFGNAAGLPWRLDAHHVYIDREAETKFEWEGDATTDFRGPDPPFAFDADHEHVAALKAFATGLLPTNTPLQESPTSGRTTRVDLVGEPHAFRHYYDKETRSTEAVLFDTDLEYEDACACCVGGPSTVVPGACLFSFRADPRDVCTPEHWGESYDYDREFGTLHRRGGRAWRVAGCAAPGSALNNADIVLEAVHFEEPGDGVYGACEVCYERDDFDFYAPRPTVAGTTVHLEFRVLKHKAGGRLASEISHKRDSCRDDLFSSDWSPYRLVMSGTVRGLPILTPVREPANEAEEVERRLRLREWKAADKDLRTKLPPCEANDIMNADRWLPGPGVERNPIYRDIEDPWWSEPQCECELCQYDIDSGRDKEFVRLSYWTTAWGTDIPLLRLGRACDAVLAQLPLNKHGRNPSNYGETKVH